MTPEENTYIEKKARHTEIALYRDWNRTDNEIIKQALKDTWNEALKQAEGVLPVEWERETEDYRGQSLQAIDTLRLK